MTDFQALHPKIKGLFDGFYTDLEEFRRKKFIFGKSHSIKKKVFLYSNVKTLSGRVAVSDFIIA